MDVEVKALTSKEPSSTEVLSPPSLEEGASNLGKRRSRKEENILGMAGRLLGKQDIYSCELGWDWAGGWALESRLVASHPALCTHTIPRHKGQEGPRTGVGLGHQSSQHPTRGCS